MTPVSIQRLDGRDLWALLYTDHLATLTKDAQETMRRSVMNSSRLWVGIIDEKLVCCWGLIPPSFLSDTAYLWLYTIDGFDEHIFIFIRKSQRAVEEILKAYPVIVGHCVVGHDKSIRWLRWLGAKFGEPQGQLLPFRIEAK